MLQTLVLPQLGQQKMLGPWDSVQYQNSECQSCGVTLKVEWQKYRMAGVMGMAGAYYAGARMQPQLIGCALAQEPGCP